MPLYKYRVTDKSGKVYTGSLEAVSAEAAGEKLQVMGFIPISIVHQRSFFGGQRVKISIGLRRPKLGEINLFSRQLYVLIDAGVPLTQALESIAQQMENQNFKSIIQEMVTDIRAGANFSSALEKYPLYFNNLYRSIIKAGEASGNLDTALQRLAILGEYEEEVRSRIHSATMYPVIVISALLVAFIIMVTFVLPRFAKIFSRFNIKLPLPTRILLGINHLFTHYGWWLFLLLVILIFVIKQFIKTSPGRRLFDQLKIKIPIFGSLLLKIMLSRFARITSGLLKSGIPVIQTMELVSQTMNNLILTKSIEEIKTAISAGKGMSEAMKQNKIFPPMIIQMVAIGEETGRLDDLLAKVSDYYDYQTNYTIKNLTTLLEPILLLVLGSGVLFIALAIFLPMWNLIYLFRR
ncbi:MAG: type II secretion system F family protein [Candidatus Omnitrophica bacterium]|nr:type II secretion system F family protein [Candidatus Omnitrophota bacterium]